MPEPSVVERLEALVRDLDGENRPYELRLVRSLCEAALYIVKVWLVKEGV